MVRVELGGVRAQDVKVTVDGELLRIQGSRRALSADDAVRLHRMEIAFGRFERTIRIAIPFERDRVNATLEEGFLTVVLPKRQAVSRRIEVETLSDETNRRREADAARSSGAPEHGEKIAVAIGAARSPRAPSCRRSSRCCRSRTPCCSRSCCRRCS